MKEIYIKRFLRLTKPSDSFPKGQGFYCSQVFQINGDLEKPPKEPLLRNDKPVYILEKEEVAIPMGRYSLGADFTGKYQIAKVLNVPKRFNIEIHAGSYLKNTIGCLLLGQNYDENKQYSNQDVIINESKNSCIWFRDDFLLNDEKNRQTRKVEQDEVIGYITID